MRRHRHRPLAATLARLRAHPFTADEVRRLWTVLDELEQEVEALGEVARREREDVTRIEQPLLRAWLWATGRLTEAEARERAEADAAMAATLTRGDQARRLREWLTTLPRTQVRLTDARVAADLQRLDESDLVRFPDDGAVLRRLWRRAHHADDLDGLAALTRDITVHLSNQRGRDPGGQLPRLRKRLAAVGEDELALQVPDTEASPFRVQRELVTLRRALVDAATRLRSGLASDLAAQVREHVRAEIPVLSAVAPGTMP